MRKRERFLRQSRMALAAAVVGLGATSAFADINFSLQPTLIDGAAVPAGTEQVLVTGAGQEVRFGLNVTVLGVDPKLYSLSGSVTTPGADLKGDLGATSSKDYLYANPNPPGGLEIKTIDLISTDAFKGIGSGVGTIKDADGDGDMDLGVVTTPQDSRAWMRTNGTVLTTKIVNGEEVQVYGPAPATGGVAVTGGMQWTAADVKFTGGSLPTLASGQATTNVTYTPPTGADAKYAGLWSEDGTTVLDGASAGAVVGGPASASMITGPDITIDKRTSANVATGAAYSANSVTVNADKTIDWLGGGTLVTNSLAIAESAPGVPTGKFDLNKGSMVINAATDVRLQVNDWVAAGRVGNDPDTNLGLWTGPGITSTATKTANEAYFFDVYTPAVVRNGDLIDFLGSGYDTFFGQPVTADSILIRQTLTGDVTLNGIIDGDDYTFIDTGYAVFQTDPALVQGYFWGDFDYDGDIDGDDYALIDTMFLVQGDVDPVGPAEVGGVSAVPEPTSALLLGLGVCGLIARRRR